MKRLLLVILLILAVIIVTLPASAQAEVEEQPAEFIFDDQITFSSIFHSETPVELAAIFFQAQNDTRTFVELATVEKLTDGEYLIQHTHPASRHHFPAFSNIEYRYEIVLEDGQTIKSPQFSFLYTDNRFEWDMLQEGPFIVYWFDGDYAFAQSILDVAQEGLDRITSILPLPEPELLHIYVYPDAKLMQDALNPGGEDWVAGHAFPDRQTMILYLPSQADAVLDMRQRIPHETMHILLSQLAGSGYANLPFWLAEGLPSMVELYPNPDYQILLDNAYARNELIPLESLCESFPRDASGALLAYAQSASFTNFLYDNFGTSGLQRLLTEYANGKSCENGAQSALGSGLEQLERRWWRESLSGNQSFSALLKIIPWLMILLLVFLAPAIYIVASIRVKKRKSEKQATKNPATVNPA